MKLSEKAALNQQHCHRPAKSGRILISPLVFSIQYFLKPEKPSTIPFL